MRQAPLFTWRRLFLLAWIAAAGWLWMRSYAHADGVNYRTAAGVHWNVRGQSGAVVAERIDESDYTGLPRGFWVESPECVLDRQRWGELFDAEWRFDWLGFNVVKGQYTWLLEKPPGAFVWTRARGVGVPYWFLVAIPLAILALVMPGAIRRRFWTEHGRCPACGYDLRASPGRCPECGRAAG